jgi:signal transduction histidine kinase
VVITVIAVVASYGEAHPTTPGTYFTGQHHLPHTPDAALLLVAAGGVVLAWRHRYPRLVLWASTAAVVAYTLPGYENGVALLLPAVAMGTLAADPSSRALRSSAWAVAVTAVLMAATASNNPLGETGGGFFLIPANIAVALFAGLALGSRRAYLDSERAQLARQAAQDAQRGIDEERVRIARELHDVVAHTMATITVQASAATTLLRDRPEQAAESLQAIRAASKNGLRELRAILNVLRAASGDSDGFVDPVQPTAGLARLDALAGGVRAAGLPVTVTVTGHPRDLPAVTDLSAYRIIQEALTNAISHAGPATAAVTVHYAADSLAVEVTDTGCGLTPMAEHELAAGTGLGHGLRGMRERASAAGGVMEIGPLPDRGFRVAARFPLDPPAQPATGSAQPDTESARPETAAAQPETAPDARSPTRDAPAASPQQGGRR